MQEEAKKVSHVSALDPTSLVGSVLMAAFSAAICMQIVCKIGITPNTSIIGAVLAMALARIPMQSLRKFRSLERQNLLQTSASAAGFTSANCVLFTAGIMFLMGHQDLVLPMAIGSITATLLGVYMVGRLYDSPLFPAKAAWPPGVATAGAIIAGDEGGKRARRLLEGIVVGIVGSYFKLPMAGVGIVFIANIFAMTALGVGLVARGYGMQLFNYNIAASYIPHGVMIGAGVVSLVQAVQIVMKKSKKPSTTGSAPSPAGTVDAAAEDAQEPTVSSERTRRVLGESAVTFALGGLVLAIVAGILTSMTAGQIAVWFVWLVFSAVVAAVLGGLCAMHSGWFPGFPMPLIFMSLGLFLKIPTVPLALLIGYIASITPVLADMGYDLKTGWLLRGHGKDRAYELAGRKQQVYAEAIGAGVAFVVALALMNMHFKLNLLPPVAKVFAATITAGAKPEIVRQLVLWAIPGAILQAVGGPGRAMGILLATGLLIQSPIYGIGVLAAVALRLIIGTEFMEIREAGLIAGDGIYGFASAVISTFH